MIQVVLIFVLFGLLALVATIAGILVQSFHEKKVDAERQVQQIQLKFSQHSALIEKQADDKIRQAQADATSKVSAVHRKMQQLRDTIKPLYKYQQIEDAKLEAEKIRNESAAEAARVVDESENKASKIMADAKEKVRELNEDELRLKNALTAIRNQISDYGDEYLVPNRTLLQDLAEDYSHKDAGVELKQAAATVKWMIKSEKAAACDYKEAARRMNAIHFVLDAFNGKADTILSKVKHNNFGKLRQELRDAFNLVNLNGDAFRNARITREYLSARESELEWAAKCHELKIQEREEQRQIREQIREEERAKKEYEKAIKDAEKEEKLLEKAMEKARQQILKASEVERAKYEQELMELQGKLKDAEERNQRAISMAQQTKRGHVYVISNLGSFGENVYKIGMTRRLEPLDRVKELGDASVPFAFDIHAMIYSEDAPDLEKNLHRRFESEQVNKVNPRKEFFRVNLSSIKEVADELGIDVHWTLASEAQEYRESMEIERRRQSSASETFA